MSENLALSRQLPFHRLKIAKKQLLTKNTFLLELEVPPLLADNFRYNAGQYLTFRLEVSGVSVTRDFSMCSAPYENTLAFALKMNDGEGFAASVYKNFEVGDEIEVSEPRGRFTLYSKPHEFRTILGFAAGIGITPVISHLKQILHQEPRTRFFLFYTNKNYASIALRGELDVLQNRYGERLQIFYFLTQEGTPNPLLRGRITRGKIKLIINQILSLDDTDEESTIWDAVNEVLICGSGAMIKETANACFEEGIPKRNIHFELFEEFNEDIYPVGQSFPLLEDIQITFTINRQNYTTTLPNNQSKILQQLLEQKFPVPYSCKSGICGSCVCQLKKGDVELIENEYLTEKEEASGLILACMAVPMSQDIHLNFDI